MRPGDLIRMFDIGRYRKLRQDFKTPLRALYAASGAPKASQPLVTREGNIMKVGRGDLPLWQAYFSGHDCRIEIEGDLFKVTPGNKNHSVYFVKGGSQGVSYQPHRWQRRDERNPLLDELEASERRVYSQHGEDGVIQSLLDHIPAKHQFVVEFGAYDGICMSNSRYLLADKEWGGFLIEADKRFYAGLSRLYAHNERVKLHNGFVTEENINELFSRAGVPRDFEVLSIDIDSIDYYVWRGLTEFQPKIVIVEYNSSIAPDVDYVVPKSDAVKLSGTSREGASLLAWYKLGLEKGYHLVYGELSGANLFFVHESCSPYLNYTGIEPIDVYQPPQFGVLAGGVAPNGRGYPEAG
jgi:hypothetical protein